jgi:hypothetical protein
MDETPVNSEECGGEYGDKMLDTVDSIRKCLNGLNGTATDQAFHKELLASLPQFVACGPQSAGKSSVMRRLSGVQLPEASTLCTRIATVLKLRRDKKRSIHVSLCDAAGVKIDTHQPCNKRQKLMHVSRVECKNPGEEVAAAVSAAQEEAIRLSNKGTDGNASQFVDTYTVYVEVRGPVCPNLTH